MNGQDYERLIEINQTMLDLFQEAKQLVRQNASSLEYERAKAYWMAGIEMGLSNDHGYLGKSPCSMIDTINSIEVDEDSFEEEDE